MRKIKAKLINIKEESRKDSLSMVDSLIDEIRFSDFGISSDVTEINSKLYSKTQALSSEVDNLISIKATNLASMELMINDIKKMIREKNMQICLTSSNI